jgi:hypothetical protein
VHRTSRTEASLSDARAKAAADGARAHAQLERLARESSQFLNAALSRDPSLRSMAAGFARAAEEVLSLTAPGKAA